MLEHIQLIRTLVFSHAETTRVTSEDMRRVQPDFLSLLTTPDRNDFAYIITYQTRFV